MQPSCLIIENCNFNDYPTGGHLSFARQMMYAFGNRLALVGITTDNTPIGKWVEKEIDGIRYQFFSVGRRKGLARKPIIPERLSMFIDLMRYRNKILSSGINNVFTQAPEILMVVSRWHMKSICYDFPGVENPLVMPRYSWGKMLINLYDKELFKALKKVDVILACADEASIQALTRRSKGSLQRDLIVHFPTRVDTSVFHTVDKRVARAVLKLPPDSLILMSCGRISHVKGWDLLLDSFSMLLNKFPHALFIFVGDGEDRNMLKTHAMALGLDGKVIITGFQKPEMVTVYINAADLMAVGSHKEGWSIAMLEALACGKNVISTNISGASDMILEGTNGFIVRSRNPEMFATAIESALSLLDPNKISVAISEKYALKHLQKEIAGLWEPLS
jgi:glycosyltransferase involved in cell wall biosynthesis